MVLMVVLAAIGLISVIAKLVDSLWSAVQLIGSYLVPYFLPSEDLPLTKRFGQWAAVTGCTDGIGREYAIELARKGLNLVLISRNYEKLTSVADLIEKKHCVKTKVIVADFGEGLEVYEHIEREIKDIPIGILVNNVGTQYDYPMYVCEVPLSTAWRLIAVNAGAVTAMSRLVAAGMLARGGGAIVNVSSGSALQPLPLMTIYAATKAYVTSFTLALREEYASKGIHVQHLCPYFVSTKMNHYSKQIMAGNLLVPDACTYARHAVATLGRVHDTNGYWAHSFQCFFSKLVPVWVRTKVGMRINMDLRKEYFRTKKLEAKSTSS